MILFILSKFAAEFSALLFGFFCLTHGVILDHLSFGMVV